VPVIRTTWKLSHRCKHCKHRWTTQEVREEEDFSRA
jgi:hypothetical protein